MTHGEAAVAIAADRMIPRPSAGPASAETDPPGGTAPVEDAAVLVDGGRIAAAGRRDAVAAEAPPGTRWFTYPGGTILPGLVDAHVHLAFDASEDPVARLRASDDATLLADMAARARTMLDAGVTTARDLGDRSGLALRLRDEIAAGVRLGPRLLAAGAPLTVPGGHCWFLGGVVDEQRPLAAAVRQHAEAGVDWIKVMVTGGGLTDGGAASWESQFGADELTVAVREAHRRGLPVAAHAHGSDGIADAVAAGVDTVEHGTWMARGGFDYRPDVVRRMVDGGTVVCPGASPNWRSFAERFGPERAEEVFGLIRRMGEAGVRLVAGTDAGVPEAVFADPVGSLEFYAYLGFSHDRILELATAGAGRGIGLGEETGRVEPGMRADLLVVAGDPRADLQALRRRLLVVAGGRPHWPA